MIISPARAAWAVLCAGLALSATGCSDGGSKNSPPPAGPPALIIQTVAPLNGPATGGTALTVTGSGFETGSILTVGGALATGLVFVSSSQLTATTPAGTAGPANVVVTNPDARTATAAAGFTYLSGPPPGPTATTLSVTNGPTAGGTVVTLSGSGFQAGATVTLGGTSATNVTVLTGGTLVFTTPPGATGPTNVVVTNPGGLSATVTNGFTYGNPAPTVAAVTPASGPMAGGTTITVTGTGFTKTASGQATVQIGAIVCSGVQILTGATLVAVTGASPTVGPRNLTVRNPDLQSGTLTAGYTYLGPAPTLTGVSPAAAPLTGGTSVTLTGTNFFPGATVTVGGTVATVTSLTGTTIVITLPAGTMGATTVIVTNPDGSSVSLSGGFTYQGPTPTLTAVAPTSGPVAGGTSVTLTGTNFAAGATVVFGTASASSVVVVSGTSITCVAPSIAPALGPTAVTVTNVDTQSATLVAGFNFLGATPTLAGLTPTSGPIAGGTTITLTGNNFATGATVTIGGAAATVAGLTATQIVATTGAGPIGPQTVVVTNLDGQAASAVGAFTYLGPFPTITSVTPAAGPQAGGTAVTLAGTNFAAGATVTVGGVALTGVTVVSATQVTGTTPNFGSALGPQAAVLTNVDGRSATLAGGFNVLGPAPTLTAVAPTSGTTGGGTALTLTGTNFATGATVTVGGTAAVSVVVVSATQITCLTPAGAAATVNVVATNVDGQAATATGAYTYVTGPGITGVAPANGPAAGGTTITLTGNNFAAGATVDIGGAAATSVVIVSTTQITAVTPAGTVGPVNVTVTNPGPQATTLPNGFTYLGATPTVTGVAPGNGAPAGGISVTITGTNFYAGVTVTFGGTAATVTSFAATQLVVTAPAASVGTVTVLVTNPDAQTASGSYTYNPAPTVSAVSPTSGALAGTNAVTLTGTGFLAGATVTFGAASATVGSQTATQLVVTAPAGTPGGVVVTVTNPDGQATTTSYTYNAQPTITAIAPTNGRLASGTVVTLTGTGFITGATVTFGAANATVSSLTATQAVVTAPAGTAGSVTVTLTNLDGQSATTSYTYNPLPTLTAIAPSNGAPAGSNSVTLTGTGFLTGVTVTFGGSGATIVSFGATQLIVTAPAGSVGTVTVTVTNPDTQAATTSYTYNPAPTISTISPTNGAPAGTNSVTLTGTGFLAGVTVSFAGNAAAVTSFAGTQLVVTAPAGSVGTVTVAVTNPDGQAASTSYAYNPAPTITGIAPTNGPLPGGTSATLTGTNFFTGVTVQFGAAGAGVTSQTLTQLVVTIPAGSAGAATVTVTNPDGQSATTTYTYNAAPAITGIAPTNGAPAGGNSVTLTGTAFVSGATVTFGASGATVLGLTATQIVVAAPAGSIGTVTVTVTNPDTQAATTSYTYNAAPTLSGISPTNGAPAGTNSVTLTGTGFLTGVTVTFAGNTAPVTSFAGTQLVVTAPAGSVGSATVTVTNPDGQAASTSYTYNPAPTISAISPTNGAPAGTNSVTLTGTGFLTGATITFGANPATGVSVTATQATCTAPAGSVGTVTVTLTNADGQSATTSYTYNPAPTISAIAPSLGAQAGGNPVTLTGTGFLAGATVTFGASNAPVGSLTATQVVVTAPASGASGAVTVTVTNPDTQTATTSYTYAPTPTITSIAPTNGAPAGGNFVTISGTNFNLSATVTFGASLAAIQTQSATQIVVQAPVGSVGTVTVTVTNPGPITVTTSYTYNPAPTITGINPTNGRLAGGNTVTITGTGFLTGATVDFGGNAATGVSGTATQLTCTAPAGTAGAVTVTVTNPDTQAATTSYTYNPFPTITGISPTNGKLAVGTAVTITGTGFLTGATVTFGPNPALGLSVTATQITGTVPAGVAGTVTVTVTNPDTQTATTSYTYNPLPTISAIAPTNGMLAGGNAVTITGTGFLTGATVTFGSNPLGSPVVTATQITGTAPAGAAGTVTVTVTNPDTQTATTSYTYNPGPAITAIAPTNGAPAGGNTATITGTGFITGATVTFGANPVSSPAVTATQITGAVPAGSAGTVTVTVTNPDTQSATTSYTYNPAPTLTAVSPGVGPEIGGIALTCTGTGFLAGATVTVGGAPATGVVVVSATSITAVLPAGTPGPAVAVVVTNADTQFATLAAAFTYRIVQTQVLTGQADFGQQHHLLTSGSSSPGDVALLPVAAGFFGDGTVITAVAYDHASTQRLLVGTDHAGAFLTTDGGATWTGFNRTSSPPLPSNRILSCAIFSNGNAGQTFIIGTDRGAVLTRSGGQDFRRYDTGSIPALPANRVEAVAFFEGNTLGDRFLMACNNATKFAGGGAAFTTDGGDSFTVFNSLSTPGIQNNYVRGVAYYSGDTTGQRFLLANYSVNFMGDGGVWLTSNGGASFTRFSTVSVPATPSQGVRGVAFFNGDTTGRTWMAAFDTKAGGAANGGAILTTDSGATPFTLFNVAGAELFSDDVSRLTFSGIAQRFAIGTEGGGISYSTNGGTAMTRLSTPTLADAWVAGLDWHRGNTTRFSVGSGTLGATTVTGGVQETTNTAGAFTAVPLGSPDVLTHPDVRQVAMFRGDGTGNRILVATATGAALTTDGGTTWTRYTMASTPALPSNDVRGVAWHEGNTTGSTFLIGTANGAVLTTNGGTGFTTFQTGSPATFPGNTVQAVAYWSGSTAGGGTWLVGTTAGLGYTTNNGGSFLVLSTGSLPNLPSNNVTGVTFYEGGTSSGGEWLAAMGGGTGGVCRTNSGGTSIIVYTTTLPSRDVRSVAFFSNASNTNNWCAGTAAGIALTASGGSPFTTYSTANGLPSNDVRAVATCSAGTVAQRFAAACGGTPGGMAFTTNSGTSFSVRNATSVPGLPSDAASSVDYDDSSATYDRWVVGLPASATSLGGIVIERGTMYAPTGMVTIPLLEGGVIPVGGPLLPTWDDRFVHAVDFHRGSTTGASVMLGGLYGGAASANGGTTFSAFTEATTPAFLLSVVASVDFCSGDASGQRFALATPFGVYVTTNGGTSFTRYGSGNGLPSDDVRAVAYHDGTTTGAVFAVATSNGIAYTINGGSSFTIRQSPTVANDCRAIDYHDGTTTGARFAVATGSGVYHTSNGGTGFTLRANGGAGTIPSNDVRAIAYDENDASGQSWLVGTWFVSPPAATGGVGYTTNDGTSFTNRLPNSIVYGVAVHPTSAGRWLVARSTSTEFTANAGVAFTPYTVANGLPTNDSRAVAFAGGVLGASHWAVATEEGVVQTVNGGTSFTKYRRGTLSAYLHVNVTETKPAGTTIRYQVLDRFWNLIPESDLPGNAAGLVPDGSGNISLASIPVATYPVVQLRALLGTSVPTSTPLLREVRVRFQY